MSTFTLISVWNKTPKGELECLTWSSPWCQSTDVGFGSLLISLSSCLCCRGTCGVRIFSTEKVLGCSVVSCQ